VTRRPAALVLVTALAAASLALTGCSSGSDAQTSVTAGPTAATASGAELDAEAFAAALKIPGTTVLDVRTPAEFAEGHLPGAVNIDISSPDFATQVAALDPTAPYAVYCRSGNRSATALATMAGIGFTGAYHLGGGIGAWQGAGGEVVTG
jgi:phage shock protein E